FVQPKHARDRTGDLGNLKRVSEPRAVVIALVLHEDLRLVLELPECGRVDDAIPIALIAGSRRALFLGNEAAAAVFWVRRVNRPLWGLEQWSQKTAGRPFRQAGHALSNDYIRRR